MFLDESAFEVDDMESDFAKPKTKTANFDLNHGRYNNSSGIYKYCLFGFYLTYLLAGVSRPGTAQSSNSSSMNNADDDDGSIGGLGSAGGLGTPNSSRARMLAQQRELQLKKRQATIQSGGKYI